MPPRSSAAPSGPSRAACPGPATASDNKAARLAEAQDRNLGPDDPTARPEYARANIERQVQGLAGDWSDWAQVDAGRNYLVLDNIVETDRELIPGPLRPPALVDPLPSLKVGTWEGVFPISLVESIEAEVGRPAKSSFRFKVATRADPANEAEPEPEQPSLMIRSLDFTVEPGATYRYRVRVVVRNPNKADKPGERLPGKLSWPWSGPSPEVKVP